MCGRVIQSGGPLRYTIVDGMNVRDSRVHNYPPRWNAAPSQELLEPILKLPTAVDRITMSNDSAQGRAVGAHRDHFPEEKIADGRPGCKPIPTRCVLSVKRMRKLPPIPPDPKRHRHLRRVVRSRGDSPQA